MFLPHLMRTISRQRKELPEIHWFQNDRIFQNIWIFEFLNLWISGQFFRICRQFFLGICRRNFLHLSTKFLGFVDNFFCICWPIFLDLLTIIFWIFQQYFLICRRNVLDLSTKISNGPMTLSNDHIIAWVTRGERPKGAKDKVKRPEGPPTTNHF